jgi:O-antigen/teichoic acid export membrane protein
MSPTSPLPPSRRRIVVGAASNWLVFGATLAVTFFLTPYLVRRLGQGPYGLWNVVESLLAYFTLFDLGIAASVERFVARFRTTGERDDLNRLVSTCFALFAGLAFAGFAVLGTATPLVLSAVADVGMPRGELLAFGFLMLGTLAATLPLSVFAATLDGAQAFAAKNAVRLVTLAVRTVGTVVVLEGPASLFNLGLVHAACTALEYAAFAALSFRTVPGLRLSWRLVDRATVKRVRGHSLYAFLAMLAGRVTVQSGPLIVGPIAGLAAVTAYALALRLVEFAKALTRSATNTLSPAISSLDAAGRVDAIRTVLLRGTKWVLYLILPVQLGLIVFGRPFLTIWMNDAELAAAVYPVLVVLSMTLSVAVAQSVAARILYGTGRLRLFARMALGEAALNAALGAALCAAFGAPGMAVGAALPNLLMCGWVVGYTARVLEVPLAAYLRDAWARPLLAAAVPLLVWSLGGWVVGGWPAFAGAILAGLVPYGVVVLGLEGRRFRFGVAARIPVPRR